MLLSLPQDSSQQACYAAPQACHFAAAHPVVAVRCPRPQAKQPGTPDVPHEGAGGRRPRHADGPSNLQAIRAAASRLFMGGDAAVIVGTPGDVPSRRDQTPRASNASAANSRRNTRDAPVSGTRGHSLGGDGRPACLRCKGPTRLPQFVAVNRCTARWTLS